jgi:alpha-beta hydrolase superfamily lysophospholipase
VAAALFALSRFVDANAGAPANYQARDRVLQRAPLRFYRSRHPHALVWFFGNDVGFWGAQQRLAAQLADGGYDVVGMDLRAWLAQRPAESPAARAAAFRTAMADLQGRAARELGDTLLPVVLAGHSVGAEVALWQGAMAPPRGLAGVVAISPGERGHLRVTATDLAYGEPTEPGSFAVADMVRDVPRDVRVAIVRGSGDPLRSADSLLVPARPGLHRVIVPLAGHSMRRLLIAGPLIAGAIVWSIAR